MALSKILMTRNNNNHCIFTFTRWVHAIAQPPPLTTAISQSTNYTDGYVGELSCRNSSVAVDLEKLMDRMVLSVDHRTKHGQSMVSLPLFYCYNFSLFNKSIIMMK
ncbi:hypothetical protein M8C21_019941 [Ambrosia artemisiifolia]|uniref:Uncharacterized protein n=1 Tax=Ambrosia artemisiifolia TaxID=4212 RepID=A0AAD5CPP9_AMBAR|nr:hypothetical protein M8C21_019941 [Ambrosia artemisiifolia]